MSTRDIFSLCLLMFIIESSAQSFDINEPKGSQVKSVHRQDFQDFINKSSLVLMEFYAPWSGQSGLLAPKYRQAAAALASSNLPRSVVLAKYDDSTEEQRKLRAADIYNFHSYPALFVFDQGRHHRYTGGLEPDDIVSYMAAVSKGQSIASEQQAALGLFESLPNYNEDILTELSEKMIETSVLTEQHAIWFVCVYSDAASASRDLATTLLGAARDALGRFAGRARFGAISTRRIVAGSPTASAMAAQPAAVAAPRVVSLFRGVRTGEAAPAALAGGDGLTRWLAERISLYGSARPPPAPAVVAGAAGASVRAAADGAAAAGNSSAAAAADTAVPKFGGIEFPGNLPWREVLGRHTWFLLHAAAAAYPDDPTEEDIQAMRFLYGSLGQHYPCKICKHHLQSQLGKGPPRRIDDSNSANLSQWVCELHNEVTWMKGKAIFDCDGRRLDLMYRKDPAECRTDGPGVKGWDAVAWERDPAAGHPEIESVAGWRLEDLEALLGRAAQYSVLDEEEAAGVRAAVASGATPRAEAVEELNRRLRRVLQLEARARRLEPKPAA